MKFLWEFLGFLSKEVSMELCGSFFPSREVSMEVDGSSLDSTKLS